MSTKNESGKSVADVMLREGHFPIVSRKVILKRALEEMGKFNLGIISIIDEDGHLLGILTDGDLRRKLLQVQKPFSALFVDDALDHAIQSPTTIHPEVSLEDGVRLMEKKQVWDLPVVDSAGVLVGLLHLHPAIQAVLEI